MARFRWVIAFEVDEVWVADGFELTEERAKEMIAHELSYSYPSETAVTILKAPAPERIRRVQGYPAGDVE